MESNPTTRAKPVLWVSVVLYLVCLTQAGLCAGGSCEGWPGWELLAFGWLETPAVATVGPFVAFAWFANPLLFVTWALVLGARHRPAISSACLPSS